MTDTTLRDQLAQIIYGTLNGQYGDFNMPDDAAEAILDAGWRPPARVVTTVEELDGLADDTLLLITRHLSNLVYEVDGGEAWLAGYGYDIRLDPDLLPATVIYEPEEGE